MSDYEGSKHEDMTRESDRTGSVSEEAFDRFVDGEMSDEERRELLRLLEAGDGPSQDGWRKLALTYVEAQTWQGDLGALATSAQEAGAIAPSTPAPKTAAVAMKADPFKLLLAMAASFLVALVIGFQFRSGGSNASVAPIDNVASQPGPSDGDNSAIAKSTLPSAVPNGTQLSSGPNSAPVVTVGDGAWRTNSTEAVPPNIAEMLRRLRHRIERKRSLVPVETEDGRRVLMPVEDIEVQYVGDEAYQ